MNNGRIVVLGNGQLGTALAALSGPAIQVFDRAILDLGDTGAIEPALAAARPEVVINAAAYNKVDEAERRPDLAFTINAVAPGAIACACAAIGARIIHVSTDYVFDGALGRPYLEDDLPAPLSVYGASKLAGEHLVRAYADDRALIVRTSAVFGTAGPEVGKGGNFVRSILRQAAAGQPLQVVNDQTTCPTYAPDLARAILSLAARPVSGLLHVTNAGACTWYQFAQAILELAQLNVPLTPTTSETRPDRARRPSYSVLSGARLAALGITMPPWRDALARYLEEIGAMLDGEVR
ncbi:MAG TPA: dTDP-4-dehydrorhamnose reductase [Chloroflexota bacterium]|nr:dTDP-4-dehydrorhamnose reductase [Chloroflexota bacterium]